MMMVELRPVEMHGLLILLHMPQGIIAKHVQCGHWATGRRLKDMLPTTGSLGLSVKRLQDELDKELARL